MSTDSSAVSPSAAGSHRGVLRPGLIAVAIISMVMNVLLLTGPFYMLQIYDRVLTSRSLATLLALSGLVAGLFVIHGMLDFLRTRLMTRVSGVLDMALAQTAFRRSLPYYQTEGEPQQPLRDLRTVQQFLTSPAATNLFDIPWMPVYITVIYIFHPMLGHLAVAGAVVLIALAAANGYASRRPARDIMEHTVREERLVGTCQHNGGELHAMGMFPAMCRDWAVHHARFLRAGECGSDTNAWFSSISRTVRLVLQSAILGCGAYLVIGDALSAGALIAASITFARALAPVDSSIAHWRSIVSARQSWGRLRELARQPGEETKSVILKKPSATLEIDELSIQTPDRQRSLVENASFNLKAGDGLAIIGPSGSGKSSLIKGLLGQLPVANGSVRLDGATLDQWDEAHRGDLIGYLPQTVRLFDGTVAQNIARFAADFDSEAVIKAARFAGVHQLITSLPDGYETQVGPGGVQLSAGQLQRIGLARAVYGSPFLIILDEPNAHLDAEGEAALNQAIAALKQEGCIVIVAAHRKVALSQTNKLLLVVAGELKCFGDRDEVIEHINQRPARKNGDLRVVSA